ncbi:hypothetical protein [Methylopila sp. Yamaguchi]|uniref:hypothetical protein n=1 Tax=Methylopila sp. Yamaguchi TaxID=1437817 RepID=UPI000CCC8B07|nr:hypothetical protein [Methylopila sp. Yamaguchi]
MHSATANRPDTERDIRELAQAIATLEVIVTGLAVAGLEGRPVVSSRIVRSLRDMADRAVFELDGMCPVMLDRVANRIEAGHGAVA